MVAFSHSSSVAKVCLSCSPSGCRKRSSVGRRSRCRAVAYVVGRVCPQKTHSEDRSIRGRSCRRVNDGREVSSVVCGICRGIASNLSTATATYGRGEGRAITVPSVYGRLSGVSSAYGTAIFCRLSTFGRRRGGPLQVRICRDPAIYGCGLSLSGRDCLSRCGISSRTSRISCRSGAATASSNLERR